MGGKVWGRDRKHLFLGWGDFSHRIWGPQTIKPNKQKPVKKTRKVCVVFVFLFFPLSKNPTKLRFFFWTKHPSPMSWGRHCLQFGGRILLLDGWFIGSHPRLHGDTCFFFGFQVFRGDAADGCFGIPGSAGIKRWSDQW